MRYKQTCDHILVPRAAILLASASDRDKLKASSGRFQSVLATDWSDGNTIKNDNRKKSEEKGILFSVCRTCNRYIISNNHPLDSFGEKTIREGIVRD